MRTLLVLAFLLILVDAICGSTAVDKDWQTFRSKFNKSYRDAAEEGIRFTAWLKNRLYIEEHNKNVSTATAGTSSGGGYYLAENHLMDLTDEEYKNLLGFKQSTRKSSNTADHPLLPNFVVPPELQPYTNTVPISQLPSTVNWTSQGYVNPVEDQGQCGDCWAFSAAGAIEGTYYNATRTAAIVSEQNLLDCSSVSPYSNGGCNGGSMVEAFQYVMDNKGIDTFSYYPYTGAMGTCQYSSSQSVGYITGYRTVQGGSEAALQQAVALIGPIAVGINAGLPSFQLYKSGVYMPSACSPLNLDHAVLAVGYGTYGGQDYWLLKNSWGTDWGIQGYMMLARNDNNLCGIASDASFPTGFVSSGQIFSDQGTGGATMITGQSLFLLVTLALTLLA